MTCHRSPHALVSSRARLAVAPLPLPLPLPTPVLAFVLAAVLAFVLAAVLAPESLRAIAAKEGPVEHVSHVVLAVAVAGWGVRACGAVAAWGGRGVVLAITVALAVVLGEELDWGSVYGVHAIGDWLALWTGRPNLHNLWGGASYLLFAAPVLGVVALGLRTRPPLQRAGWAGPQRPDALALLGVGAFSLGFTLLLPAFEPELDEIAELLAYALLAVIACRPGGRRGQGRVRAHDSSLVATGAGDRTPDAPMRAAIVDRAKMAT